MELTYVGHATVSISMAGTVILTDPILRNRVAFLRRTSPAPSTASLHNVRATLISHLHQDHCDLPSLALVGRDRTVVVPRGSERFFRRHGFTDVVAMRPGQTVRVGSVEITATEAEHDGRRRPFGSASASVGYVIAGGGVRVYFAGDTDLFTAMADLGPALDVALLPVAGWGRTLGPGHLDPVRAAEAARRLGPTLAVPIHWGSLRPLWYRAPSASAATAPANAFAVEVQRRDLPTEVRVLQPGASLIWRR